MTIGAPTSHLPIAQSNVNKTPKNENNSRKTYIAYKYTNVLYGEFIYFLFGRLLLNVIISKRTWSMTCTAASLVVMSVTLLVISVNIYTVFPNIDKKQTYVVWRCYPIISHSAALCCRTKRHTEYKQQTSCVSVVFEGV